MSVLRLDQCPVVNYADVREDIRSGDVLALHHDFVPSWYGLQIAMVQAFTGPLAHLGLLHVANGRVWLLESVVPYVRYSPLTNVAGEEFFWFPISIPMSQEEEEFAFSLVGIGDPQTGTYSKTLAVQMAIQLKLRILSGQDTSADSEQKTLEKMQCAKYVDLCREKSGVNMGHSYIPTESAEALIIRYGVQPVRVKM